jgi:hypothetical protein
MPLEQLRPPTGVKGGVGRGSPWPLPAAGRSSEPRSAEPLRASRRGAASCPAIEQEARENSAWRRPLTRTHPTYARGHPLRGTHPA